MKVLTVKEPWASLIALGEKKIETRSWKTNYRGILLIHASKKIDKQSCSRELFKSILSKYDYNINNLPTGMIIAKCNLVSCQKIVEGPGDCAITDGHILINGDEYEFGNYGVGRYTWFLKDIQRLEKPIQAKGRLGLWDVNWGQING